MQLKKALAGILSVTVLSLSAGTVFANNAENLNVEQTKGTLPVSDSKEAIQSQFGYFTGTVKEIRESNSDKDLKYVLVESEDGQIANLMISKDTYMVTDAKIAVGTVITGFYDANAPMVLIYPPQYNAEVVVVGNDQNVKVDKFDKDLLSADQSLKLNISEDTEIISKDGEAFKGKLENRNLVVLYGITTRSIPAQTNPTKIVVLPEKADAPVDVSGMEIVVDGKVIKAPAAYTNHQGVAMVPLRVIAEALGFDVKWDGEQQSVTIGKGISLTIDKDYYTYMKTAPIQLGTAPEISQGTTFVPLSFFEEVMKLKNAYVFESQIVINDDEKME